MNEITKISTKGQVVIPLSIRSELGLEIGSPMIVAKMNDFVILKKIDLTDIKKEFSDLTELGSLWAKKKRINSEEDVLKKIHEGRKS